MKRFTLAPMLIALLLLGLVLSACDTSAPSASHRLSPTSVPATSATPSPVPTALPTLTADPGLHIVLSLTNAQDAASGTVTQSASGQIPAKKTFSLRTACLGSGTIEVAIIGVMSVSVHCPELFERDQSSSATLPASQQYTAQVATTQGSVIWEIAIEE